MGFSEGSHLRVSSLIALSTTAAAACVAWAVQSIVAGESDDEGSIDDGPVTGFGSAITIGVVCELSDGTEGVVVIVGLGSSIKNKTLGSPKGRADGIGSRISSTKTNKQWRATTTTSATNRLVNLPLVILVSDSALLRELQPGLPLAVALAAHLQNQSPGLREINASP